MAHTATQNTGTTGAGFATLLAGYRFYVAQDAETFARALAVRYKVYVEDFGYDIDVPDDFDHRSWLLVAEHVESQDIVGTMRVTPRTLGPIEAEEYFTLPADLDRAEVVEISRFAILKGFRKPRTILPAVSIGLFRLCYDLALRVGAERQLVCSKAERMWTYESLGFRATGLSAAYEKLNGVSHQILWHDFRRAGEWLAGSPLHELFCELSLDTVECPAETPPLGLTNRLRAGECSAMGEPLHGALSDFAVAMTLCQENEPRPLSWQSYPARARQQR